MAPETPVLSGNLSPEQLRQVSPPTGPCVVASNSTHSDHSDASWGSRRSGEMTGTGPPAPTDSCVLAQKDSDGFEATVGLSGDTTAATLKAGQGISAV